MNYPGGKNAVYQKIINQMPPHDVYIEPFLGSGAVMRMKQPARINYGLDLDSEQLKAVKDVITKPIGTTWLFFNKDAIEWLSENTVEPDDLIYLDPPYLHSTRRSPRQLYRYELTDDDHQRLLSIITGLDCYVMISGYWSQMYAEALTDWRYITFEAMTRGGAPATEYLWMNYPEPEALHDYRYLGANYRERERIKRKKQRWVKKLQGLDVLERRAILWAIEESGIARNDDAGSALVKNDGTAGSSGMAVKHG